MAIVAAVVRGDYEWSTAQWSGRQVTIAEEGAFMGDKGGKKDKEKNKQQQLTKQKQEEQKKHDNAPAKKPAAGTA
jgi:prophage tail gpP-like protein